MTNQSRGIDSQCDTQRRWVSVVTHILTHSLTTSSFDVSVILRIFGIFIWNYFGIWNKSFTKHIIGFPRIHLYSFSESGVASVIIWFLADTVDNFI